MSTIEPELAEKLGKRKRPLPDDLHALDSSSVISTTTTTSHYPTHSIPAQSYAESRKKARAFSNSGALKLEDQSNWRQTKGLTQASPMLERPTTIDSSFPSLEDSPMFDAPSASDDEDQDYMVPSIQEPSSSIISSSPPRTPPPARRSLTSTKQAGADLLLYLAHSPRTPAVHVHHISSVTKGMPSTPPHQHTNLPSSVMQTPGNLGLFNGALQTPGNFNLAEFCNVTPSPAQTQFSRYETPALGPTPCRSTRRSLNFDTLLPPSPSGQRRQGFALQLGEELERQ